jgi:hypothetical protein
LVAFVAWVAGACLASTALADQTPSQDDLQALLKSTDDIAATVSHLRGLPIKTKIARGLMSRPEITKRLLQRVDEDYPAGELIAEERAYKLLGLLPVTTDYKKLVIDLLTEQIAGFYDPEAKELYLADWIEPASQRMVMAHEIDHALQDQTFDLVKFTKPIKDNADEELARQSLVEGDGVALMIEFLLGETGQKQDPWANDQVVDMMAAATGVSGDGELDKAPLFVRESLIFPYVSGLRFIAASRRTHPWSDIDSIFRSPPLSTEQILHPEKYRAGEKPIPIKAADMRGWTRIYDNVLGEMMMGVLLRQYNVPKDEATRAAAGWGGDRIVVYAPATGDDGKSVDKLLGVDLSAWDQEADAIEACNSLKKITNSIVERRGNKVLLLINAPADSAAKIAADVWASWQ